MFDLVENYNRCLDSIDVASAVAFQQRHLGRVHFEMTNLVVRIRGESICPDNKFAKPLLGTLSLGAG